MNDKKLYQRQFERVERWYNRLQKMKDADMSNFPDAMNLVSDTMYAFFINCYHLKDWIINDELVTLPNKKTIIKEFIENNDCMKLCADVCNGTKHLKLNHIRNDVQPRPMHRIIIDKNGNIEISHFVEIDGKEKDFFELSTECIEKWREFFRENRL
jgi:hypothetical protein